MQKIFSRAARLVLMAVLALLALQHSFAEEIAGDTPRLKAAAKVAFEDFSAALAKQNDNTSELAVFAADVHNYEQKVREEQEYFVVRFSPKPYQGRRLKGGAVTYKISRDDLKIVEIVRHK